VTFCGYSVPHPSEQKINLRIQTNGEAVGISVLSGCLEVDNHLHAMNGIQQVCFNHHVNFACAPVPKQPDKHGTCASCECSDWSGVAAVDALRKGLEDLQEMCGHVLQTFQVVEGSYGGSYG
jgi:DNA-directed RNA polymerase subunit L